MMLQPIPIDLIRVFMYFMKLGFSNSYIKLDQTIN